MYRRHGGARMNRRGILSKISDTTSPTLLSATLAADGTIDLTFTEPVSIADDPSTTTFTDQFVFTVGVLGEPLLIASGGGAIAGAVVTITPQITLPRNVVMTVAYTRSGSATFELKDAAGNYVANFSGQSVTTSSGPVDSTAPTVTATIGFDDDYYLDLTCDNDFFDATSIAAASTLVLSGTSATTSDPGEITQYQLDGLSVVRYWLTGTVYAAETVTLASTASGDRLQDLAGNDMANFSGMAVDNQSEAVRIAVSSVTCDTTGCELTVTYNKAHNSTAGATLAQWVLTNGALHTDHRTYSPVASSFPSTTTQKLTFSIPVFTSGTCTLAFTSSGDPVTANDGSGTIANFSGQAVTTTGSHQVAPAMLVYMRKASSFTQSGGAITALIDVISGSSFSSSQGAGLTYSATANNGFPAWVASNASFGAIRGTIPAAIEALVEDTTPNYAMAVCWDPGNPDVTGNIFMARNSGGGSDTLSLGTNVTGSGRYIAYVDNGTAADSLITDNTVAQTTQTVIWHRTNSTTSYFTIDGTLDTHGGSLAKTPDPVDVLSFGGGLTASSCNGSVSFCAFYAEDIYNNDAETALIGWMRHATAGFNY